MEHLLSAWYCVQLSKQTLSVDFLMTPCLLHSTDEEIESHPRIGNIQILELRLKTWFMRLHGWSSSQEHQTTAMARLY